METTWMLVRVNARAALGRQLLFGLVLGIGSLWSASLLYLHESFKCRNIQYSVHEVNMLTRVRSNGCARDITTPSSFDGCAISVLAHLQGIIKATVDASMLYPS
ncbi:hypothetical protein CI102_10308 [Trichoderma harzianum]|nr:hypothetical protein CI102_10308 [Trichoderma harzianum]